MLGITSGSSPSSLNLQNMVTLRSYSNAIEAALAKSRLDDRGILCTLADENVHLYGGGPLAMPVRLLVAEDRAEEALRILDTKGPELQENFESTADDSTSTTTEDINQQTLSELRRLRHMNDWMAIGLVILLVITVYLLSELPQRTTSPWSDVTKAMHRYDFRQALHLAKRITSQYPNDYYGHEYLGNIYFEMGDFENAEAEYTRAAELAPPRFLQEKAKNAHARREHEASAKASPATTPQ
jgi:tetratricopeptide (TPR) repeat protein